jgi:hypothetical protein
VVFIKKPVVEVDTTTMWNYEYQAKMADPGSLGNGQFILASDSLINLKREIRNHGYKIAWLTATNGSFSCGQNIVDEYPYRPRNA